MYGQIIICRYVFKGPPTIRENLNPCLKWPSVVESNKIFG